MPVMVAVYAMVRPIFWVGVVVAVWIVVVVTIVVAVSV